MTAVLDALEMRTWLWTWTPLTRRRDCSHGRPIAAKTGDMTVDMDAFKTRTW